MRSLAQVVISTDLSMAAAVRAEEMQDRGSIEAMHRSVINHALLKFTIRASLAMGDESTTTPEVPWNDDTFDLREEEKEEIIEACPAAGLSETLKEVTKKEEDTDEDERSGQEDDNNYAQGSLSPKAEDFSFKMSPKMEVEDDECDNEDQDFSFPLLFS